MADSIQEIVAGLERLDSVTEVCDLAERLAEGDASFLADLGIALTKRYGSDRASGWQYRSVFDHLLRLLTSTPGRENVEQALRLTAGGGDRRRVRQVASLLAAGHPPQDLTVVFSGGSSRARSSEELRACLLHELVLRGVSVEQTPGVARWATSPHWSFHPLGWLPLSLTALEGRPALPSYSRGGGASYSMPFVPLDGPTIRPEAGRRVPSATETTTESAVSEIAAAVANWAHESNGRIEARRYELAEELNADAVAGTLLTLGLECLSGLDRRSRFVFSSCPPSHAWRVLFAAASTGGAYNNGEYGAYGRLAAWRSVAALTGCPTGASPAEVERLAHACAWYGFGATTDWFEQVAWDFGLVVVTPDRRRLAVLAATDTD